MVHLPVRKCFYVAKVTVVVILVVALLTTVERWRGGRRTARAFEDPMEAEWERQILEDERRIIPGLGEGGVAAELTGRDKQLGEASEQKLAINVYLSDRIAYNRTLEDHRNPACQRVVYDAELPSASVVIIFHNEPYSVVLRTIWSVLESARRDRPWHRRANFVDPHTSRTMTLGYPGQDPNSPFVYLKEIILVDDNSTLPELRGKLSHYVRTRLPPNLIRILRLPDRVGLTRARLAGARVAAGDALVFLDAHCEAGRDWLRPLLQRVRDAPRAVPMPIIDVITSDDFYYSVQDPTFFQGLMRARMRGARSARGSVLVFLDAHCEVTADWLRPLLQRIKHKRDSVLTPLIDVIDQTTFELEAAQEFQVGGFTFMGHFTWIDVSEQEKKRRGSDIAPTWSPTMAGGLFAIQREYYWEVGAYDEQMAGWGGENLEMSFRIWQCGGTLETIPCSRVGHVFRAFHPYAMPANSDTHGINTARMAEVWMDDYKELFYLHRPDLRKNPKIGDVTHRKILREKLQCKSFEWYLRHVYRDKFVPVRDALAHGRVRSAASGLCLDTLQRELDAAPLGVYPCHDTLQGTQYFSLSLDGQLRDEERCATLQHVREAEEDSGAGRKLLMFSCSKASHGQKWRYTSSKQVVHVASGLCVDAAFQGGADVTATRCADRRPSQRWDFDYSQLDGFRSRDGSEPSEAELTLQKLRGQRRMSRSLLAADNSTWRRAHRPRRRKHARSRKHSRVKKSRSKTKNKFILKLVRTLRNNSEEHLEVDIHCRHRRLLPGDAFVRDLVSILTDRNIKVINNGRVFERNRVSQLVSPSARHLPGGPGEGEGEKVGLPPPRTAAPPARKEALRGPAAGWVAKRHEMKVHAAGFMQPVNALTNTVEGGGFPADAPHKKIIIEDFVEVKPASTSRPAHLQRVSQAKKRKKHPPAPSPAPAPAPAHAHRETSRPRDESRDTPPQTSLEEMVAASSEPAGGDDRQTDEWFGGAESRYEVRRHSADREDRDLAHTAVSPASGEAPPSPLKVVVRSNLTFNLGEEFFKWRAKDDVADLLGGLAIPPNSSRAPPPLVATTVARDGGDRDRDGSARVKNVSERDMEGGATDRDGGVSDRDRGARDMDGDARDRDGGARDKDGDARDKDGDDRDKDGDDRDKDGDDRDNDGGARDKDVAVTGRGAHEVIEEEDSSSSSESADVDS